ncbi:unnamed protein product [Urochloa decumbens]|uniref:Uncharacterized protein n=1 Tax=Urochloa decumbens TaxID=240449 RepID=A0ABC9ASS5_9POAL
MPEGNMERAHRIAYAFVHDDAPTGNVAPYIRAAIFAAAPGAHFRLFPSSRGTMALRFDSKAMRDYVVDQSPLLHDEGRIDLERSEEGDNRFQFQPEWLALAAATGFPDEHWDEAGIRAAFRKVSNVVEIDPDCLPVEPDGEPLDCSSIRVLVERFRPSDLPDDIYVGNPSDGLGTMFNVETLRVWRREEQLDGQGSLRPFFRRPPTPGPNAFNGPPPPGPWTRHGLGPAGGGPAFPYGGLPPPLLGPNRFNGLDAVDSLLRAAYRMMAFSLLRPLNLPVILTSTPVPPLPNSPSSTPATILLGLPWYPQASASPPPPPPPSPADTPPSPPPPATSPAAAPSRRGRRPRSTTSTVAASRNSSRIAAQAPTHFVDSTAKAMQRKALRKSLANCSNDLKRHVASRRIFKRKNPIGALDLRRLAKAAGLSCADQRAVALADVGTPIP